MLSAQLVDTRHMDVYYSGRCELCAFACFHITVSIVFTLDTSLRNPRPQLLYCKALLR